MKRKRILNYVVILILISILLASCKNQGATSNKTEEQGKKQEEEEKDKNANEDTTSSEDKDKEQNSEEDTTNPGVNEGSTGTKEESEDTKEVPIGITDRAIISGMADDILENMTLEEKVGQLFIVNLELIDDSQGNYYEFRKITKSMKEQLKKYKIGGVCLFARNIETREQTTDLINDLQKVSKFPLFVTVDEEGGEVARIAGNDNMQTTKFPTMEEVGSYDDKEYAFNVGDTIGKEIRELGFNVDFAPVADVRTNELNMEIGSRSFGNNPKVVASMVKEVVEGLQGQGISATLKHFPGHGDAKDDSHEGAVNVENDIERLRDVEFVPFKAGIKAGADFIMVSHISISRVTESTIPASLSSLVMKEMLRTELGFNGIIISDAFNMKAITDNYTAKQASKKAFEAGADMLLMPESFVEAYHSILNAVNKDTISEERLDESVKRILEVKIKRGLIKEDTNLIPEEVQK